MGFHQQKSKSECYKNPSFYLSFHCVNFEVKSAKGRAKDRFQALLSKCKLVVVFLDKINRLCAFEEGTTFLSWCCTPGSISLCNFTRALCFQSGVVHLHEALRFCPAKLQIAQDVLHLPNSPQSHQFFSLASKYNHHILWSRVFLLGLVFSILKSKTLASRVKP